MCRNAWDDQDQQVLLQQGQEQVLLSDHQVHQLDQEVILLPDQEVVHQLDQEVILLPDQEVVLLPDQEVVLLPDQEVVLLPDQEVVHQLDLDQPCWTLTNLNLIQVVFLVCTCSWKPVQLAT